MIRRMTRQYLIAINYNMVNPLVELLNSEIPILQLNSCLQLFSRIKPLSTIRYDTIIPTETDRWRTMNNWTHPPIRPSWILRKICSVLIAENANFTDLHFMQNIPKILFANIYCGVQEQNGVKRTSDAQSQVKLGGLVWNSMLSD